MDFLTLKQIEPGSIILLNDENFLITSNENTLLGHSVRQLIELSTYRVKFLSNDFVISSHLVRKRGFYTIIRSSEEPGDKAEKLANITENEDLKEVVKYLQEYLEAQEV